MVYFVLTALLRVPVKESTRKSNKIKRILNEGVKKGEDEVIWTAGNKGGYAENEAILATKYLMPKSKWSSAWYLRTLFIAMTLKITCFYTVMIVRKYISLRCCH
jgi:hypothetical protein